MARQLDTETGERERRRHERASADFLAGRNALRLAGSEAERVVDHVCARDQALAGFGELNALQRGLGALAALVLLLFAMNWLLPDPTAEPVYSSVGRPVIRISSIETLPERVVFDTSMPYMAPPPSVMRGAARPLQSAFAFEQLTPGSLPTLLILAQVTPKKPITTKRDPAKITAKRDPAKKVVTSRVAPQAHIAAVKNYPVREAELDTKPPVKTTFLDDIAGRFGQIFREN